MDTRLLLNASGMSEKAGQLYLAFLQKGTCSMTEIAKAADLKRPTAYLAVDELVRLGVLALSKKGKRTTYTPEPPERLLAVAKSREKEMERLLPELEAIYLQPKEKPRISVFEGREALRRIYNSIFQTITEEDEEALFCTAIGDLQDNYPDVIEDFLSAIKKTKRPYRMRELNVGDDRGIAYAKNILALGHPHHHVRHLDPKRFLFKNTDVLILDDRVMLFSMHKDIFTLVIEHGEIAQALRTMFEAAWLTGNEVTL